MKRFAVIENNIVKNIIIADSKKSADESTNNLCVEIPRGYFAVIEEYFNGSFKPLIPPFPSWTLDNNDEWQPPIPMPAEGLWRWNEDNQTWNELVDE